MATESIALYIRIPKELAERIELGRVAGYGDSPWRAPTKQAFLIGLLEANLPRGIDPKTSATKSTKKARKR